MKGIFGWSYPPGCSGPPEEDTICQVCGRDAEVPAEDGGCGCPECPTCHSCGCLVHMDQRKLMSELNRLACVLHNHEQEARRRYALKPALCLTCKKPMTYDEARMMEGLAEHPDCEAKRVKDEEAM